MKKILTLIGTAFLLVSCATAPVQIDTLNNPPPVFKPVMPAPISITAVHWTVLTQKQISELAKSKDPNVVFYALTPDDFQNLALNFADIKRYMEQEKTVILTYNQYYGGLMAAPATSK